MRSPKGVLEDGRKVTGELFQQLLGEELAKVKASSSQGGRADDKYVEFLTLPAYQQID